MTEAPLDMRKVLEEIRRSGDYALFVEAIPYARFLGLQVSMQEGRLLTTMRAQDRLVGNPVLPAIHGGTLGALLESAAVFTLLWEGETPRVPKAINVTVEFMRSARVVDTHARATITKLGRRVANVQVQAWQSDETKPVAAAHCHFRLRSSPDGDA